MSALCATAGQSAPQSFFTGTDQLRKIGANYFFLHECDSVWVDLLDAAEWTTKQAADAIRLSPPGSLVVQPPTQTSFPIEGCGREATGESVYLIDFTTYQDGIFTAAVPSSLSYWLDVFNNRAGYRLSWWDCENKHFTDDGWMAEVGAGAPATIAGESPGFEFSITIPPHWVAGQEELGIWSMQFQVKKTGLLQYYQLASDVIAAIV